MYQIPAHFRHPIVGDVAADPRDVTFSAVKLRKLHWGEQVPDFLCTAEARVNGRHVSIVKARKQRLRQEHRLSGGKEWREHGVVPETSRVSRQAPSRLRILYLVHLR